jgi:hypothetical protein
MMRIVALLVITLAACSSQPAAQTPEPAPIAPAEPSAGEPYVDAMGVQRAKMDPSAVEVVRCKTTVDDYGYHGAKARFRATNTTTLQGVVSLTVQYQNGAGDAVAEGVPGVANIKPGQAVVLDDSVGVEKGDFPGDRVRCVVVDAEVYVPVQ